MRTKTMTLAYASFVLALAQSPQHSAQPPSARERWTTC